MRKKQPSQIIFTRLPHRDWNKKYQLKFFFNVVKQAYIRRVKGSEDSNVKQCKKCQLLVIEKYQTFISLILFCLRHLNFRPSSSWFKILIFKLFQANYCIDTPNILILIFCYNSAHYYFNILLTLCFHNLSQNYSVADQNPLYWLGELNTPYPGVACDCDEWGIVRILRRTICAVSLVWRGGILPRNSAARAISVMRDRVTHFNWTYHTLIIIHQIHLSLSHWRKFAAGSEINSSGSLSRTIDYDSRKTNQKLCYILGISHCININKWPGACRVSAQALRGTFIDLECSSECFLLHSTTIRSAQLTFLAVTNKK